MGKSSWRIRRLHRVDPQTAGPRVEFWWTRLRRRRNWTRLLAAGLAGLVLVLVVDGGGPPVPFRLGQVPDRDITVRFPFVKVDKTETENLRREAARSAPPVVVNDPGKIAALEKGLLAFVSALARSDTPTTLPKDLAADWTLKPDELQVLHAALRDPAVAAEVQERLRLGLARLARWGLLDRKTLHVPAGQRLPDHVWLVSPETGKADQLVPVDQVNLASLADPDARNNPLVDVLVNLEPKLVSVLFSLLTQRLEPTLTLDDRLTEAVRRAARAEVKEVTISYEPGSGKILAAQNRPIGPDELTLLQLEHEAWLASLSLPHRLARVGAIGLVVGLMLVLVGTYVCRREPALAGSLRRVLTLGLVAVATVGLSRLFEADPWHAHLLPLMVAATVMAMAYTPLLSLLVSTCLVLLTAVALGSSLGGTLAALAATASATLFMGRIRNRLTLVKMGVGLGVVAAAATYAAGTLEQTALALMAADTTRALACGVVTGFLISGSLPFIERLFGLVTDISLLELSDVSHPLLQHLVQKAPGTYSHSNAVAALAEAAAEAIHANALLCRVGSYYHDIGKVVKPAYFVENQGDAESRHRALAPAMSTLIIIGHVKDGVDLARQHNLPEPLVRFIEEHHGTTLVEYFYHLAAKQAAGREQVEDSLFRYPGPRPTSKETAIVMLADAVESAARTLSEPNPGSLEGLVEKVVAKRLNEGQLDDSGLTLTEVKAIRQSLVKGLLSLYHGRVKYPAAQRA